MSLWRLNERIVEMDISIDIKSNVRCHRITGAIDIAELIDYLKGIYNSNDLDQEMDVLWDMRKADFTNLCTQDIQLFKQFVGKNWGRSGKSKAALVVDHDVGYGLSRMYEIMMESESLSTVQVFRGMEEAREWMKMG